MLDIAQNDKMSGECLMPVWRWGEKWIVIKIFWLFCNSMCFIKAGFPQVKLPTLQFSQVICRSFLVFSAQHHVQHMLYQNYFRQAESPLNGYLISTIIEFVPGMSDFFHVSEIPAAFLKTKQSNKKTPNLKPMKRSKRATKLHSFYVRKELQLQFLGIISNHQQILII